MRISIIPILLICFYAMNDAVLGAGGALSLPSTAPALHAPEDIQIDRAELFQRMMHAHQHAPENGTFSGTAVFETVEAKVSPPTEADLKLYQRSIKARIERDVRAGTFFEPEEAAALKRAGHNPSNPDDAVVQQEISEAAKDSVEAYIKMMSSRGGTHEVESRFDAIVDRKNRELLWRSWLLATARSTTEAASKRNPAPDETPDQIYSITRPLLTVYNPKAHDATIDAGSAAGKRFPSSDQLLDLTRGGKPFLIDYSPQQIRKVTHETTPQREVLRVVFVDEPKIGAGNVTIDWLLPDKGYSLLRSKHYVVGKLNEILENSQFVHDNHGFWFPKSQTVTVVRKVSLPGAVQQKMMAGQLSIASDEVLNGQQIHSKTEMRVTIQSFKLNLTNIDAKMQFTLPPGVMVTDLIQMRAGVKADHYRTK